MALIPKLYSLRGLRFGTTLATLSSVSLASGLAALLLLPATEHNLWPLSILTTLALVGASACVAMLLVPAAEVMFRVGLLHFNTVFSRIAGPLLVLLGAAASASVVMSMARSALGLPLSDTAVLAPVLALVGALLLLCVLATIYAAAVTSYRSGQVSRWTQRLNAFRARFPEAKVDRIAEFLDMETRRSPAQFSEHGASFPGITQRPFHDDFPRLRWMLELEENFEQVRKELMAVIQEAKTEELGWFSFQKQFKQFRFYADGRPHLANCAKCPKTAEILSAVSTNSEVLCTILHPGSRLKNHIDFASPTLVYQLGVKIPPNCGIRVGTESRTWQEGKSMVFDNAYEHEVWNDSSEIRVVLLVDFFHPELTETEHRFFKGQLEDVPSPVKNEKPAAAA